MQKEQNKDLSFRDLMIRRQREKCEYYDDAYQKFTTDYVTLAKRNDGDYMGVMREKQRNTWQPVLSKGFFTYPVIPRSIRSKTATAVSTDIDLDFESALKVPEKEAGAEVAHNVYKYVEEHYWTERLETLVAMLGQIGRFAAILTEKDDESGLSVGFREDKKRGWMQTDDDMIGCQDCAAVFSPEQLNLSPVNNAVEEPEAPEITENDSLPADDEENAPEDAETQKKGIYDEMELPERAGNIAEKPDGGMYDNPDEMLDDLPDEPQSNQYDLSNAVCLNPSCKSTNLTLASEAKYEVGEVPTGTRQAIRAAKITQKVVSSLLIRYDDVHTIGFDWQKAHWFNYHPLESKYEIIDGFPEIENEIIGGNYSEWSDSARWYYELSKSGGNLGAAAMTHQSALDELIETNYWFYEPVMCNGWTEPDGGGYELIKNKKVVFSIKPGETIEKACLRSFGDKEFRGLMVKMCGETIVDVQNTSFLDWFTLIGWNLSVTSHAPTGEERLIQLQDAATRVFTMIYSCVQRLSMPKMWADERVWNRSDLLSNQPGQVVMSKQGVDPADLPRGIDGSVGYIQPPNPSNVVNMFVDLIIQIAKEESGIFDETVGAVNTGNQTARGREAALNQSLGLMTPTQKAKKEGKIAWTRLMLRLWQQMPDEAFILIKGTYQEEWKAADIRAFKTMDVDEELVIKVVEGTDIPKSQPQMLQNFQIAAQMGLLSPNELIEPQLQQYILKNVLGIDYDIGNMDADRRLAARRLEAMHEVVDGYAKKSGYDQLIVLESDKLLGVPVRKLHPELLLTLAQDVRTKCRQEDNHAVYAGFYIDQIKGVTGGREPREIDVLILENALDMHNQMIAAKAAQEMMAKTAAAPPTVDPNAEPKAEKASAKPAGAA